MLKEQISQMSFSEMLMGQEEERHQQSRLREGDSLANRPPIVKQHPTIATYIGKNSPSSKTS